MLPFTHKQTHAWKIHYCKRACLCGTCTLSSRQQGPVSNHDRVWICGMLRANDLRHMSSPCGFKTKHCQEHSAFALAGQSAPYFAFLRMQQAMQTSKSKMKPIIICFVLFCCAPYPSTLLHPSKQPPQICLGGLRGRHNTQKTESVHITHSGRSCLAMDGKDKENT